MASKLQDETREINSFLGIPYARPFQRFKQAELTELTESTLDARQHLGPNCPQGMGKVDHVIGSLVQRSGAYDEFLCGVLSIFTPFAFSTTRDHECHIPVVVFIHGGALDSGRCQDPKYDGSRLARDGSVVVVTINYRHGVFGFLYETDTALEQDKLPCGTSDVRVALDWIHANIAAFGGDKANVTLLGQSAGGYTIQTMLDICPELFHRAILLSGPASLIHPPQQGQEVLRLVLESLPDGVSLQNASTEHLVEAQTKAIRNMPHLLSPLVPTCLSLKPPSGRRSATPAQAKTILIVWNSKEATCLRKFGPNSVTLSDDQIAAISSEVFVQPAMQLVATLRSNGHKVTALEQTWSPQGSWWEATHGTELPLLFGDRSAWETTAIIQGTSWQEWDARGLEYRRMVGNFARDGSEPHLRDSVEVF